MTRSEITTLAIAVVLSLFFWAYFRLSQGTEQQSVVMADIPVILGQSSTFVAEVQGRSPTVDIIVKGPSAEVAKVSRTGLTVRIPTEKLQGGETKILPVKVDPSTLPNVTFTPQPAQLPVHAVPLRSKTFPVDVSFVAAPPAGTTVGDYVISPYNVDVEGTDDELAQVKYVTVNIDPSQTLTKPVSLVPQPVNADGVRVEGTTVREPTVSVAVGSTTGERTSRSVAVGTPKLLNVPAGLTVRVVGVTPRVVTVTGGQSARDRLDAYLPMEDMDVHDITKDSSRTGHLQVPAGLTVMEGVDVRVDLEVRP
jgi:YbbR domain-containing protein